MATKPEKIPKQLTSYMTQAKKPRHASTSSLIDAVKAFLPALEAASLEAVELHRSLQEAELVEPDVGRKQHYEEVFQKIGAIRRISSEVSAAVRQLVKAFQELDDANTRLRDQIPGPQEMR